MEVKVNIFIILKDAIKTLSLKPVMKNDVFSSNREKEASRMYTITSRTFIAVPLINRILGLFCQSCGSAVRWCVCIRVCVCVCIRVYSCVSVCVCL
jgi:hypothetical protein